MTKKAFNKIKDWGATILGLIVAIATDLLVIDWVNFSFKKEWPKLLLSVIIAAGGYFSTLKLKDSKEKQE